ncbi:hypothetical protein Pcinc_027784 [Petrolisthes cinctipes]|uniref:PIH1 domain-containing protein 1 n=1 Tax=Petrolisthes cinctipes TaxID=88211 RepID=A0AAE1KA95_PETCI|nr:hypothetical protein Pcinc_027784 [Petrolisthes cinctipes]
MKESGDREIITGNCEGVEMEGRDIRGGEKEGETNGVCVKTRDSSGEKVFVNVCTSPQVPVPEDLTDKELLAILESDQPSDFRVPMSIGKPHDEKDKSGGVCVAYDVIINPQFLDKISDNPLFHNFFMICMLEALEEKYSSSLDKNGWTLLKNKKYLGEMSDQNIRTSLPLVQQLSGARKWTPSNLPPYSTSSTSGPPAPSQSQSLITELSTKPLTSQKLEKPQPKFLLRREREEGGNETLVAEVDFPSQVTGKGVDVRVGEDRLVVEGSDGLLDVFLPLKLDNATPNAHFVTSTRVLVVRVPILHT